MLSPEESLKRIITLIDVYESLANKHPATKEELETSIAEMKLVKQNILSLIIESKKGLRKTENKLRF